jgi:hypothetical protein
MFYMRTSLYFRPRIDPIRIQQDPNAPCIRDEEHQTGNPQRQKDVLRLKFESISYG